jgi:hypothetical protein
MERLKAYENKYDWDSWNTGKISHQEPSEMKKVYKDHEWRGTQLACDANGNLLEIQMTN